jgi:hypothetical protein
MFRAPITYRPALLLGTTIIALQIVDVLATGTGVASLLSERLAK